MKLPSPEESALSVNDVCKALGLVDIAADGTVTYRRKIVDAAINTGRLKSYCLSRGRRKRKFVVLPEDLRQFLKSCEYKPCRKNFEQMESVEQMDKARPLESNSMTEVMTKRPACASARRSARTSAARLRRVSETEEAPKYHAASAPAQAEDPLARVVAWQPVRARGRTPLRSHRTRAAPRRARLPRAR